MPTYKSKMQKDFIISAAFVISLFAAASVYAADISAGAAPKGDAQAVANRIIKRNHPACKKVTNVKRRPDGSISAQCNGAGFLVFTVFNPKEGRAVELALNCAAAKRHLNITC